MRDTTRLTTKTFAYGQIRANDEIKEAPFRYCLYARKSTEEDERQALSIDSQIKEMLQLAQKENLTVIDVKKESHSAKDSGKRMVFNELLQDVRAGKFNAILTWAPGRVSRNAGDLGSVVDLMDQGQLKEIRTNGQVFKNSPNEKFLLMILCSQAKLENDNKGINVKRGMRAKCDMGIRPGHCPLGYLNEKLAIRGKSRIIIDPERAPIIKQVFEKVGNQMITGLEVYKWLRDEVKFTTRTGKKLTLSGLYRLLGMTFYYREFEYPMNSGNWYQGSHEPLITKELFEKTRDNLQSSPKHRYGLNEFQFSKLIKCGNCEGAITAEEKIKRLPDGSQKRYVYYHCTRHVDTNCREPYIKEEELLNQIVEMAGKLKFKDNAIYKRIKEEIKRFNMMASAISGGDAKSKSKIKEKGADIKAYVKYILENGKIEEKREMLGNLNSKLILKDKELIIKLLKNI